MPAARLVARLSAPASLLSTCERRTTIGLARVAGSGLWPSSALLSQPHPPTSVHSPIAIRHASNSSSTRWLNRQSRDPYTKGSKLSALKSRAAFKLLEINEKHHLFRPGQTVVDLGYAPGSWSQVAKSRVGENGKVVGIDVIPAQPPRGVSTLQGDFLSESVQGRLREYVREQDERIRRLDLQQGDREEDELEEEAEQSVVERARAPSPASSPAAGEESGENTGKQSQRAQDAALGRVVDVVLSDMCAPWPLEINSWIKSVNTPFRRMMNTSGNSFRDHAGSMVRFCRPLQITIIC